MDRHSNGQRGAAIVESALVALILITLLFGIAEFGLLFRDDLAIRQAAYEGARTAALGEPTGVVVGRVIASAPITDITAGDVTLERRASSTGAWAALGNSGTQNDAASGSYVRVTVRHQHHWATGLFSSGSTTLSADMTTRRE